MTDPDPSSPSFGWTVGDEGATRRLADEARALLDALRRADAPSDDLERAARLVQEATSILAAHRVEGVPMQGRVGPEGPVGGASVDPAVFFPWSPIIGPLNPMSAAMTLEFDTGSGTMQGRARFDTRFTGPPGMVHGGVLALAFDELLGATNVCTGVGAFTGTLSVRYERPTPIETDLTMEARVDRVEGRKVFTVGTIEHDGAVTARAEGVFVRAGLWMPES